MLPAASGVQVLSVIVKVGVATVVVPTTALAVAVQPFAPVTVAV